MFEETESLISSPAGRTLSPASTNMKGTRSLARLRDRVDLAVKELDRLRDENKKMRRDLDKVAHQPAMHVEGTPVIFSESGPELRSRIEECIRVIDAHMTEDHLAAENVAESDVATNDVAAGRVEEKLEV